MNELDRLHDLAKAVGRLLDGPEFDSVDATDNVVSAYDAWDQNYPNA